MNTENIDNSKIKLNNISKQIGKILVILLGLIIISQLLYSQEIGGIKNNTLPDNSPIATINEEQVLTLIIPDELQTIVSIRDLEGNMIKLLLFDYLPTGKYEIDLKNQIEAGNYLCKISCGNYDLTLKFITQ